MSRDLVELKDKHLGEEVYVIGNGPSVNDFDFNKLIDKNIIVTNCFHQHPLYSKFKHMYHIEMNGAFRLNPKVTEWKVKNLLKNPNSTFILRYKFKDYWEKTRIPKDRIYYLSIDYSHTVMDGFFRFDITKGSYWANTGVIEGGMAMAQYMGFKTIYLIGCDVSGFENRGGYFYDWKKTPIVYHPREGDKGDFKRMKASWKTISKKLPEKGINVYNLSEFSKLEYFERKKFEDVI